MLLSNIDKDTFAGFELSGNLSSFNIAKGKLITNHLASLSGRFKVASDEAKVIKATSIAKLVQITVWTGTFQRHDEMLLKSVQQKENDFGNMGDSGLKRIKEASIRGKMGDNHRCKDIINIFVCIILEMRIG